MSSLDIGIFAIRRRPGRTAFEVRWRVAGRDKSRSFMTRALADSYRAELVRAARRGLGFDPSTGEPAAWAEPVTVTWYQHAVTYAEMKWPCLAPHSLAGTAEALATVTPLRHAALSLVLNASGAPAEIAARAGNNARVLYDVYLHCIDSQEDLISQRIEDALDTGTGIAH